MRVGGFLGLVTALLTASVAWAQSPSDFLPREPGARADRAAGVTPREPPGADGPLAPQPAGGVFALRGVALEGATALGAAELQPIWSELIGTRVSLTTLDEIAARIGATYRARGFVLSQAFIPPQTIERGVVRVRIVEGFIDQVRIDGGAPNQQLAARRLFAPLPPDRPLSLTTLERAVLLSRDTFGGTVETILEPAPDTFAAADLTVAIIPDPFTGFGAVDNRGSRLYGAWTAATGGSAYNMLRLNERIDLLVAGAIDGSLTFAQGVFDVPLPFLDGTLLDGGRLVLEGDISDGEPDLAKAGSPSDLTLTINETNLGAALFVPFIRTRAQNLFGRIGLDWQDSENATGFVSAADEDVDKLLVLDAHVTWDVADRIGGVTLADLELRQGLSIDGVTGIGAAGPAAGSADFTTAALTLSRLQRIGGGPWSVYGEVIGQLASTILPNSERFSLGDATIGRGFAPGNTTGDSGYGGRLEVRRQVAGSTLGTFAEAMELYAFSDYGSAYDRSLDRDGSQWDSLGSVGFGARIDLRPWLTLTPEIARQTDGVATDTTATGLETRAYIGAIARF